MKLIQILQTIDGLSKLNKTAKPWMVGGIPRDKLLGRKNDLADIDLTTGDESIHALAQQSAIKMAKDVSSFRVMNDGHSRILINNWKIDFSSNFTVPNINSILVEKGMNRISSMDEEIYSRDFTCNTLLWSLDLKQIYDVTHKAKVDISNKLIDTCLDPEITLGNDFKRIPRAIYLSSKLGFSISDRTKNWIKNNPQAIQDCGDDFTKKKLNKALLYNPSNTIALLDELNLWKFIPTTPELIKYMNSPGRI